MNVIERLKNLNVLRRFLDVFRRTKTFKKEKKMRKSFKNVFSINMCVMVVLALANSKLQNKNKKIPLVTSFEIGTLKNNRI